MPRFVTDSAEMDRAVTRVNDVDSTIQASLSALRAEVATAPAHFKGEAARTFAGLMEAYDRDALRLSQALRGIADELKMASRDYATRDDERSSALKSSGSGLNM